MCSLDPTRSKLALTRVRFDAEGLQVLPLSNQSEERKGDSQHFSGPSSQVFRQVVRYRRHHGAPHRLLPHQRGGDRLLHGQDYHEHRQEEKCQ